MSKADTTVTRRSRRAGYTGVVLGALLVATGVALGLGLGSEPELLVGCAAIALLGLLMAAAGFIALEVAKRRRDVRHLARRNDVVHLLALVVGFGGAGLCAALASSTNGFALAFAVAVVAYSAFAIAQFNKVSLRVA
jgi:hypothetical protein